jgi:disulfide bond formation protein DsbB
LGGLAALASAGLGGYHAGVEQKWWPGPNTCTSQSIEGLSTDDLLAQIMNAPVVRCDEIPWDMFGISMAGWNMIISLGLAALWLMALRRD